MVGNAIIPDEKSPKMMKVEGNNVAISAKEFYFVNKIFEAWENAKIEAGCKRCSDSDFAAICCL